MKNSGNFFSTVQGVLTNGDDRLDFRMDNTLFTGGFGVAGRILRTGASSILRGDAKSGFASFSLVFGSLPAWLQVLSSSWPSKSSSKSKIFSETLVTEESAELQR